MAAVPTSPEDRLAFIEQAICMRGGRAALKEAASELRLDRAVVKAAVSDQGWALEFASDAFRRDADLVLLAARKDPKVLTLADAHLLSDHDFMRRLVGLHWAEIKRASAAICGDREVILEAVKQNWNALRYASQSLCSDPEIVLAAASQDVRALGLAPTELFADPCFMVNLVKLHWSELKQAPDEIRADRNVVLEAIRHNGLALQFASPELRADHTVVLSAIRCNPASFAYAAQDLRWDRGFMLKLIRQDWLELKRAPAAIRDDREIALEAVTQSWLALQHLSEGQLGDPEIMLAAARQDSRALAWASKALLQDSTFAAALVRQDWRELARMPPELRADSSVVEAAVEQNWLALQHADPKVQGLGDVVLAAVRQDARALSYAAEELLADRSFMMRLVRHDWQQLKGAKASIRGDRMIVLEAVRGNWQALQYASPWLRSDPELVWAAVRQDTRALDHASGTIFEDTNFMLELVTLSWQDIKRAGANVKANSEVMFAAVKQNGLALEYGSPCIRANHRIVHAAAQQNARALDFANETLLAESMFMLRLVEQNWEHFHRARGLAASDPKIACEVVRQNWMALKELGDVFRKDPTVVLQAAEQDEHALEFAADSLFADRCFMHCLVKLHWGELKRASVEIAADREIVLDAVRMNWRALKFAAAGLRSDMEIMLEVVRQDPKALSHVAEPLLSDRVFWLKLVQYRWEELKRAPASFRGDKGIVAAAVHHNWQALEFASAELRASEDVVLAAVQQCAQAARFASDWSLPVMLEVVRQDWRSATCFLGRQLSLSDAVALADANPRVIQHSALRTHKEMVLAAVRRNGLALQYAGPVFRSNLEVITAAVSQHTAALKFASSALRREVVQMVGNGLGTSSSGLQSLPTLGKLDLAAATTELQATDVATDLVSDVAGPFHGVACTPLLQRLAAVVGRIAQPVMVLASIREASHLKDIADIVNALHGKLDRENSRVFSLREASYGDRGGAPYLKPSGWARFALTCPEITALEAWPVAYHGTTLPRALLIAAEGFRYPSSWREVAHGQVYSSTKQTIYCTPSIEYASHPVYSALQEARRGTWLQVVLQVRVRPAKFSPQPGTLGNKHWPRDVRIDPHFPTLEGLEWLIEDPSDVIVTGLLLRELGGGAEARLFGDTAFRVSQGPSGPEYEWTRLRAEEFRERGLLMEISGGSRQLGLACETACSEAEIPAYDTKIAMPEGKPSFKSAVDATQRAQSGGRVNVRSRPSKDRCAVSRELVLQNIPCETSCSEAELQPPSQGIKSIADGMRANGHMSGPLMEAVSHTPPCDVIAESTDRIATQKVCSKVPKIPRRPARAHVRPPPPIKRSASAVVPSGNSGGKGPSGTTTPSCVKGAGTPSAAQPNSCLMSRNRHAGSPICSKERMSAITPIQTARPGSAGALRRASCQSPKVCRATSAKSLSCLSALRPIASPLSPTSRDNTLASEAASESPTSAHAHQNKRFQVPSPLARPHSRSS